MKPIHFAVSVLVCLTVALPASASAQTTIDFNDGTDLASIGSFYSGLGVVFQNANWDDFPCNDDFPGECASLGVDGLKLVGGGGGGQSIFQPSPANPIVALFSTPIFMLSINALNIGANGARVVAYDIFSNVLDFAEDFGIGAGVTNNPLLVVSTAGMISRVEFFQPLTGAGEGLLFDVMTFDQVKVPEPGSVLLVVTGLLGLGLTARRRRKEEA